MLKLKYLPIILITLLLGCSNDDDNQGNSIIDNVEENNSDKEGTIVKPSIPNTGAESNTTTNIPNDFVIAYNFDNQLTDLSANNHKSKPVNLTYTTGRKTDRGSAANFSRDSQSYIEVSHSNAISLNKEMTMSIWFYYQRQNNNSFYTIVEKSNPDDGGHSRYGMWVYNEGIIEMCIEPDTCPDTLCQECLDTKERLVENTWNHLVGVFDGTNLKLYLNGEENATKNIGIAGISQTNFELFLGTDIYGDPNYLNGRIDDFRLYNRALSVTEIGALFSE